MGYRGMNLTEYLPPSVVYAARRDQRYFREISSPDVRRIYEAMDEVLDPMEYEGSLLFDEYPDTGELSRLTELVLCKAQKPEGPLVFDTDAGFGSADAGTENVKACFGNAEAETGDSAQTRELVKALLCEEMCCRRFRHLVRRAGLSAQKP